jgi:hypothetical protein
VDTNQPPAIGRASLTVDDEIRLGGLNRHELRHRQGFRSNSKKSPSTMDASAIFPDRVTSPAIYLAISSRGSLHHDTISVDAILSACSFVNHSTLV